MTRSVVDRFVGYQRLRRRIESAARLGLDALLFRPRPDRDEQRIDFGNYDYLGLCSHPSVRQAAKAAIDRYGTSVSASRIVSGQIGLHAELERRLAAFLGTADCLVLVSGYLTNVTVIDHLFGRADLIVHDHGAHNSILTGSRLAGAETASYPCQDWPALEGLLAERRSRHRRALLVAEGIYSMEGGVLDLARANAARQRHDLLLMVDEAHSLGVLGRTGRGIVEHAGLPADAVDIRMGTLSKALASCGGYIAGDAGLIEYLRFLAPGFIFSVGLSPPDTAASLAALEVLEREPARVEGLRERIRLFRQTGRGLGLPLTGDPDSPVASLVIGDAERCMELSRRLMEAGVDVPPVLPPAVARNAARLRFFVTLRHSPAQIATALRIVAREVRDLPHLEAAE
jgi:8-amino-7-oxononanoate synthase